MEIILKEDVVNLVYKNDIVTVKSGYEMCIRDSPYIKSILIFRKPAVRQFWKARMACSAVWRR